MNILKYDVKANEAIVLANATQYPILKSSVSEEISPDLQYMLIGHDYQTIFRYTTLARYSILDLKSNYMIELSSVS